MDKIFFFIRGISSTKYISVSKYIESADGKAMQNRDDIAAGIRQELPYDDSDGEQEGVILDTA